MPLHFYKQILTTLWKQAEGLNALELRNLKIIIDSKFTHDVLGWTNEYKANIYKNFESYLIDQIDTLTPKTFGEVCFSINVVIDEDSYDSISEFPEFLNAMQIKTSSWAIEGLIPMD